MKIRILNAPEKVQLPLERLVLSAGGHIADRFDTSVMPTIVYMKDISFGERKVLRSALHVPFSNLIVLASNAEVGALAWRIRADQFYIIPFTKSTAADFLLNTLRLHRVHSNRRHSFSISYNKGLEIIECSKITYCQADGNYTYIHFTNGRRWLVSQKLKEIEEKTAGVHFLHRLGKSYIVNIDNVIRVEDELVIFKGLETKPIKLSPSYLMKLKKQLLWYYE